MKTGQIIILILTAIVFLRGLWTDFYGVKKREPYGFPGAIVTCIVTALVLLCYWKAGALSTILP